jgi:ubiquinone/menaquinone biosynthesis C-methylase UbiE
MKRVVIPELLDVDAGTPAEIETALADLKLINRWFGGIETTLHLVRDVAVRFSLTHLSLLEVAAGSGESAYAVRSRLAKAGIDLKVTLLDRSRAHLNGARNAVVADALALPFQDEQFDVVSCGLFAHHLESDEVLRFANEALRVARRAVLINDLIRHPLHLAMVYGGFPLFRSRLTRHDSVASVRRAYTVPEMKNILENTQAARVDFHRHYLFRMGIIAWKRANGAPASGHV